MSAAAPSAPLRRTVAEHAAVVSALLAGAQPALEDIPLAAAASRVLARDVTAPGNLPPFTNSQMDGYAVRSADLVAGSGTGAGTRAAGRDGLVRLAVAAPIPAGRAPAPLEPGSAAPVMTGAMLPEGADAVVPIEQALPDSFYPADSGERFVELPAGIRPGTYVRAAGSDIAAGARALPAGTRLGPAQLGLLAGLGLDRVQVAARPRVLLLTTGDEVVEPGHSLAPGQIHDANSTLLRASLEEASVTVLRSRILADSPGEFEERLLADLAEQPVDLILSSGGISKGAYEVVRQALARHDVDFVSVAMQPGGPQGAGTVNGVPYLAFPGNPVSSLVSFEVFLRPVLVEKWGARPRTAVRGRLAAGTTSPADKHQVRRGRWRDGTVELVGGPGSHLVAALAASNALVHLPVGIQDAPAGTEVAVWLLD